MINMSQDKRKYPRRPVDLELEIRFPSGQTRTVHTRDISEGGLFLLLSRTEQPMLGEMIGVQLIGESATQEVLPSGEAIVVHCADDGIGVAFIEMELDDEF